MLVFFYLFFFTIDLNVRHIPPALPRNTRSGNNFTEPAACLLSFITKDGSQGQNCNQSVSLASFLRAFLCAPFPFRGHFWDIPDGYIDTPCEHSLGFLYTGSYLENKRLGKVSFREVYVPYTYLARGGSNRI